MAERCGSLDGSRCQPMPSSSTLSTATENCDHHHNVSSSSSSSSSSSCCKMNTNFSNPESKPGVNCEPSCSGNKVKINLNTTKIKATSSSASSTPSSPSSPSSVTGDDITTTTVTATGSINKNIIVQSTSRCISNGADCKSDPMNANSSTSGTMECPLCLLELPHQCFPMLTSCPHRACYDCLQQYLKIEISESRINISCPQCVEPVHPNDIKMILDDATYLHKYENFMLRRVLVTEPDSRWCPAPDCDYVVIASGCASCPKLRCSRPGCETSFCYHCKQEWHPNLTCDNARLMRNKHLNHGSNSRYKPRSSSIASSHGSVKARDDVKACPSCKVSIIKIDDGSCNHITCSVCGTEFCWLCLKQIGDLHFLSPSGCTFWGKKPWSRKKKILWQLGMLIGAPVGIALIAGIAVPAIIIGVPVWVGRTLHARFAKQGMNQHKKNLLVTSGVVTSVIISPILTAVAVCMGVPILLAYVYGVVPISLCRSGGCGVNNSSRGKIDLDDEESEIGLNASKFASDGLSVDTTLSNKGANPSIGEVSFGLSTSLSMGSGSHLDKMERDASNAALAGSIISSSKMQEPSSKRYSVSSGQQSMQSETASNTISFSERCSANLSLGDDASMRALAGSLVANNYKDLMCKDLCSGTSSGATGGDFKAFAPAEVHTLEGESSSSCVGKGLHKPCRCEDAHSTKSAKLLDSKVASGSKCVSFLPTGTKGKLNKFESRSCDQLANYCMICDQVHRPCCPVYALSMRSSNSKTSASPKAGTNSGKEKSLKGLRSLYNGQFNFLRRKESIKSTVSDTASQHDDKKPQELKRVKSSETSKMNAKKSSGTSSLSLGPPLTDVSNQAQ